MELDELKNAWTALDDRLKKNETLNERMVQEMLLNKSKKHLNKLINFELFSTVLCFLALPFIIFMIGRVKHTPMVDIMGYLAIGMIGVGCITQSVKFLLLLKFNFTKTIGSNIKVIQQYNLFIKREKVGMTIFIPILFTVIIFAFISLGKIEAWRWTAVVSTLVFSIVMCVWQYKKIYDANITSITKSLEELKELEEE